MEKIEFCEDINNKLKDELSLLDSKLLKLEMKTSDNELLIELEFELARSNGKILKLVCEDIIEIGFYYSNEFIFYNVERVKYLEGDEYIYLSLDPDESDNDISDDDQDFIKMKKVSGFVF